MDTENLTNEGMKQPTGSLAYELADSLSGEMDELAGENDRLEEEVSEATDRLIDCCSDYSIFSTIYQTIRKKEPGAICGITSKELWNCSMMQ
jgi:hypothetical protein